MTTNQPPNDDTRDFATLKTILDLAALPPGSLNLSRAPKRVQEAADLGAAKVAASVLTTAGMKELTSWLEEQIGRRDGF